MVINCENADISEIITVFNADADDEIDFDLENIVYDSNIWIKKKQFFKIK